MFERRTASQSPRPVDARPLDGRVATRDVAAFEALYDRYSAMVFGISLRLLGDAASAEDVTQAVFLKLWLRPDAFKGGSFAAWVARVARNAGLDVLRQRSVRAETQIAADVPVEGAVDDVVFAGIDARLVRRALLRLSASERVPIELGFFGGMTHYRIAAETGVPLGTVKTRIRSGLHRLRAALQQLPVA